MFKKDKPVNSFDTVIGETTKILGNVSFSGTLKINGIVDGNISLSGNSVSNKQDDQLIIGTKGSVKGSVNANNIVVDGHIVGDINANNTLVLASTSIVEGNVFYKTISMKVGTRFSGKLNPKYSGKSFSKPEETNVVVNANEENSNKQKNTAPAKSGNKMDKGRSSHNNQIKNNYVKNSK